jgi:hypothetical protein
MLVWTATDAVLVRAHHSGTQFVEYTPLTRESENPSGR